MTSEPSTKRSLVFWLALFLVVALVASVGLMLFGPNAAIVVSPQTTHVTSPLGPDGLPDFEAYFLAESSAGITPDNNAAVPILEATWPGELSADECELVARAVGISIPQRKEKLTSVYGDVNQNLIREWLVRINQDPNQVDDVLASVYVHPWTSESIPPLGQWVRENQTPLDEIVVGLQRPRFFMPSPSLLDDRDQGVLLILLPGLNAQREVARALVARAMWHAGEGRPMDAWSDLRAALQLGRHVRRDGQFLIGELIGIAIEAIAHQAIPNALHAASLSPEQSRTILADLNALPGLPPPGAAIEYERIAFVDTVIRLSQGALEMEQIVSRDDGGSMVDAALWDWTAIDWNQVLIDGNQLYDQTTDAISIERRAERLLALEALDRRIQDIESRRAKIGHRLRSGMTRSGRSRDAADAILSRLLPALNALSQARERAATMEQLTGIAAALSVYRAEHGEYPNAIEQLVPSVLAEIPIDIYSDKPLIYRRKSDGGYLLYSVFRNGRDDGGTAFNNDALVRGEWVDEDADPTSRTDTDLVIRVPVRSDGLLSLRESR